MRRYFGFLLIAFLAVFFFNVDAAFGQRTMSFGGVSVKRGKTVNVPVLLYSLGNEASTSFSVGFDKTRLVYQFAAKGTDAPIGSALSINSTYAAEGQLGLLLDSFSPFAASPPTRQVLYVRFMAKSTAPLGCTPITFTNFPTAKSISNTSGTLLTATWVNNCVNIIS